MDGGGDLEGVGGEVGEVGFFFGRGGRVRVGVRGEQVS